MKVVFASGFESGTPCLTGPPEMLCREIDPSRPVPASGGGVACDSARTTQQNKASRIRNSSSDCCLFKVGWNGTGIKSTNSNYHTIGCRQKKPRVLSNWSSLRTTCRDSARRSEEHTFE